MRDVNGSRKRNQAGDGCLFVVAGFDSGWYRILQGVVALIHQALASLWRKRIHALGQMGS